MDHNTAQSINNLQLFYRVRHIHLLSFPSLPSLLSIHPSIHPTFFPSLLLIHPSIFPSLPPSLSSFLHIIKLYKELPLFLSFLDGPTNPENPINCWGKEHRQTCIRSYNSTFSGQHPMSFGKNAKQPAYLKRSSSAADKKSTECVTGFAMRSRTSKVSCRLITHTHTHTHTHTKQLMPVWRTSMASTGIKIYK